MIVPGRLRDTLAPALAARQAAAGALARCGKARSNFLSDSRAAAPLQGVDNACAELSMGQSRAQFTGARRSIGRRGPGGQQRRFQAHDGLAIHAAMVGLRCKL